MIPGGVLLDRAEKVGAALHTAGGTARVDELAQQTGLGQTTMAKAMRELQAAGLVERIGGAKGRPRLTPAGAVRFAAVEPISAGAVLDAAAAVWPDAHAAFLRLFLAAAVARWHLGPAGPHLGFVVVGEPRTGKSALFGQVCHLLGLDAEVHTREPALMTPAEIVGRRSMSGDSVAFQAAAYLSRPVVLLDEFDKAPAALRERAQKVLLQGKYRTIVDDDLLEVRCTPLLAANLPGDGTDRFAHFHPAYRTRRAVLLDAGSARRELADLGPRLREYYATHLAGQLDLAVLDPPAATPACWASLWADLRGYLMPAHFDDFPDERALDHLAAGYAALRDVRADDADGLALAAIYALSDWHTCASTVPGVIDASVGIPQLDLTEAHRAVYGDRPEFVSLEAAIAAHHVGTEDRAAEAQERQRARMRISDDVIRGRAELAEELRLAAAQIDARKVPETDKPQAAGLRSTLDKLRRSVEQLSRPDHLQAAQVRAAPYLSDARALAARISATRAERERDRQARLNADRESRLIAARAEKAEKARTAQAKKNTREELSRVGKRLAQIETLYARTTTRPDERPLDTLRGLGLVHYVAPAVPAEEPRRGLIAWLIAPASTAGTWVGTNGHRFAGYPGSCPAFDQWGEHTRALLAPSIIQDQRREDALCAILGAAPRTTRPQVLSVAAAAPAIAIGLSKYGVRPV